MRDPHHGQPIYTAGTPLSQARAALILIHGRGATAEDILVLTPEFAADGVAYLAPQAVNNTWYPYRFLEPIERNEPWLSSALHVLDELVVQVLTTNIVLKRIMLLGFSQGACLTLEYAARQAQHYGGIVGLSGGLIGPEIDPQRYAGSFEGTPIFLGCSDVDPHIPLERVHDSTRVLRQLGGAVTEHIYPNLGHAINQDELTVVRRLLQALA